MGPDTLHETAVSQQPSLDQERERLTPQIKEFRRSVDALINRFPLDRSDNTGSLVTGRFNPAYFEAFDQARIHLIDAKMWAGKLLEALGSPFPAELADKAE